LIPSFVVVLGIETFYVSGLNRSINDTPMRQKRKKKPEKEEEVYEEEVREEALNV
jgi:hypothetical protein